MAPAWAVPQMLKRNGLTLQDFDFYEIHEAFAAQVLCTLKAWEIGGLLQEPPRPGRRRSARSTAASSMWSAPRWPLGHPFAATGARIVATAAKLLKEKGQGRALISICTAGGMGVAAIVER